MLTVGLGRKEEEEEEEKEEEKEEGLETNENFGEEWRSLRQKVSFFECNIC